MSENDDTTGHTPDDTRPQRLGQLGEHNRGYVNPGYTRMVRTLRLILPVLALLIVGVVFAWPKMDEIKPALTQETAPQKKTGSNELIKPKYQGLDNSGQPYTVTADRAVQSTGDPDAVLLDQPRGQTKLTDGDIIYVQAVNGTYRQKAQRLTLENDVRLRNAQGYHMEGQRVTVDMDAHKAWTDLPVRGAGPSGTIEATGLQADTTTGILVFTGPATLVLTHAGMKGF